MIADLIKDFADLLDALPEEHPRRQILKLLHEAICCDLHFIDRHPTTLFQCVWNSCWWYDCPEMAEHCIVPKGGWKDPPPWEQDGLKLSQVMEGFLAQKMRCTPTVMWVRSIRPPADCLGSGQVAVLRGHNLGVTGVSFSPDGHQIASCSNDGSVRVWGVQNSIQLLSMDPCHERYNHNHARFAFFTIDGRMLVVGYQRDCLIRIWDPGSGRLIRCLGGHLHTITCGARSPSSPHHFASGAYDGTLRLWDLESGIELRSYQSLYQMAVINDVDYSPDGCKIAFSEFAIREHQHFVRVWDLRTGTIDTCFAFSGLPDKKIKCIAFAPSGTELLTGSEDGIITVWNLVERCQRWQLREESPIKDVVYSPDGKCFAVCVGFTIIIREHLGECRCLGTFDLARGNLTKLAFAPDGSLIAGAFLDIERRDDVIRVWKVHSSAIRIELRGDGDWLTGISFSFDGDQLCSRTHRGAFLSWNTKTGLCQPVDYFSADDNCDDCQTAYWTAVPIQEKAWGRAPFFETEIRSVVDDEIVGWFSAWIGGGNQVAGSAVCAIRKHPNAEMWGGAWAGHLYIFQLEMGVE